jgi:ABC-type multidrug transport system fused ATPase/permease subunit
MTSFINGLIRPYRGTIAIIVLAMLVETAAGLAGPWPLKVILDNVIGHHPLPVWIAPHVGTAAHAQANLAILVSLALIAIAALGALASYIDNYYTESLGQWVANDLRLKVFAHLERLSLTFFDSHESANILSTLTDDVATIEGFASSSTLSLLVDLLTIVGMFGIMLWLNFDFALIAFTVAPFLLLFVMRFRGAVKKATREVRHRESDILKVMQEALDCMRAVKAFGRQDFEVARLAEAGSKSVAAALSARRIKSVISPTIAVVVSLCTAFVLWRGTDLILAKAMTVGALTVFLAYLTKFFKPVQDLGKMTNAIAQTTVAIERIRSLLDVDQMIPESANPRPLNDVRGAIAFDDVSFSYEPGVPVLKSISFSIEPGQLVGIVGATGGGKSTIINLIPRFYDATSGSVLLDGYDVREYDLRELRAHVGFVQQDCTLLPGSIGENIGFGKLGATIEEIVAAAKVANAHDFIAAMPQKYDTQVGERGFKLSGGQRQRISIARALLKNAPVLMLDEPTAALDTESEMLVIEAMERLMKGRTVITIAHRLSTIRDADTIVVLKDGIVAEQGTHRELMSLDGVYAKLHRIQFDTAATATAIA